MNKKKVIDRLSDNNFLSEGVNKFCEDGNEAITNSEE